MYLVDWTKKGQMKFKVDKHKARYMGKKKTNTTILPLHKMIGTELVVTAREKNPGAKT